MFIGALAISIVLLALFGLFAYRFATTNQHRERRNAVAVVNGLGELATEDGTLWSGSALGLMVSISTAGGPPSAVEAEKVRSIAGKLAPLKASALPFISREMAAWGVHRSELIEPYAIELADDGNYVLEFTHPDDLDGVYRVDFSDDVPTSCDRDD